MLLIILVAYLIVLLINLAIYGAFFLCGLAIALLGKRAGFEQFIQAFGTKPGRIKIAAAIAVTMGFAIPISLNTPCHDGRAIASTGDMVLRSRLKNTRNLAIMFDPDSIHQRSYPARDLLSWPRLLFAGVADSVLIGWPSAVGDDFDLSEPVVNTMWSNILGATVTFPTVHPTSIKANCSGWQPAGASSARRARSKAPIRSFFYSNSPNRSFLDWTVHAGRWSPTGSACFRRPTANGA